MAARRATLSLISLLLVLFFAIGNARPGGMISAPFRLTESAQAAMIAFPSGNLSALENWRALAANLSSALALPPVDLGRSIVNPKVPGWCCLTDWRNHTVVLNQTSVLAATDGGPLILLTYSGSARLSQASIEGAFGPASLPMDLSTARERVRETLVRLGLPGVAYSTAWWNGTGSFIINGSVVATRTITVVAYVDPVDAPMGFGNELKMVFDVNRGFAIELGIFPWFTAPPPTVSIQQAFSRALSTLNGTVAGMFSSGAVYLAFDSITYNLTYQVEARYLQDATSRVYADYRVWINPYNAEVTYTVEVPPKPHLPLTGNTLDIWIVVGWAAVVATAAMIGVGLVFIETLRLAALGPLVFLYLRLRRDGALDHFVRGQLYAYIINRPGVTFSEVRDAFSLANGTATYHVAILQTLGFVSSRNDGRFRRYFAVERAGQALGRKLSRLQYDVLLKTRELGAVTPSDVAKALGISRQRASYNLRRLLDAGLLAEDSSRRGTYLPTTEPDSPISDSSPD